MYRVLASPSSANIPSSPNFILLLSSLFTMAALPASHITETNLSRLLSRLDRKLGFSTTNTYTTPSSLPTSLERAKIAANLEYARQLLLALEKESDSIRNFTQRQNALSKLGQQKIAIRRLNETLQIITHNEGARGSDSEGDSDVGEDALGAIHSDSKARVDEPPVYSLEPTAELHRVSSPSEGLRNRFATQKEERVALFSGSGVQEGEDDDEFSEKKLDSQRHEQEALTTDMLTLAQQLKLNSIRFNEELQEEKGLRDLAAEGLDKNVLGIERTGRKMDTLRRNENVGWLWGILYPVIIVALMFLILLIVFFAPKLRWW